MESELFISLFSFVSLLSCPFRLYILLVFLSYKSSFLWISLAEFLLFHSLSNFFFSLVHRKITTTSMTQQMGSLLLNHAIIIQGEEGNKNHIETIPSSACNEVFFCCIFIRCHVILIQFTNAWPGQCTENKMGRNS